MRKITWLILLFIAFIWLAIATYWTGTESTTTKLEYPAAPADISSTDISPTAISSPSAEVQLSPTSTASVILISPAVNVDLRY